jgi:ParB-like chromosome segregation protein Spo0J
MSMSLKPHPASEIFPLMTGKEFDELFNDIKLVGLREPIVLHEGMILDGRNRLRACERANIEPSFISFDGSDPLRFVISKNLIRRHLRDSQRAMIAADLATREVGWNRFNGSNAPSQSEAAQLLRVSEQSLHRAIAVRKNGVPELKDALRSGDVSVNVAHAVARLPALKQVETIARGKRALVAEARKARKPSAGRGRQQYAALWKCVDAICDALEHSQLDRAHSSAGELQKEIKRVVTSRRRA